MPHVTIQINSGKSDDQKQQLADAIPDDFIRLFGYDPDHVSVAVTEASPEEWKKRVYGPEIMDKQDELYKEPGYTM